MTNIDLSAARRAALSDRLKAHGLRTTTPRLVLADLLFGAGDRHITAEALYGEARQAGLKVSQATIYNTLNQFCDAGLLREVQVDQARSYFDTNLDEHHHFYVEAEGRLIDIDRDAVQLGKVPQAPGGFNVAGIDIIIRLEK